MSRIGKKPVVLGQGVEAALKEGHLTVKGPKGVLTLILSPHVVVQLQDKTLTVKPRTEDRIAQSHHGLVRNLIQNMVTGVSQPFTKELEIQGVGFRAEVKGKNLQLALGFSHPVLYPIPEGIHIEVKNQTKVTISGCDKIKVGQTAAELRSLKKPEPYQGKGIRYLGEVVREKVGKAAAGAQGA